ncbi:PRD domain-containing protein [Alkalibaculum sp. M08DMB]|uniref:PRD domain-containing protein n=1 Tax=Alkalibaculum sporogenes TaxID=2655001 RepID=A0A6A7K8Q8_9FIRM|nr:PRD domain-containing protein [Alkalibaculum sporogenes]MPW25577.1 PRD domain-containing protein [Alkalibaculum sporogenes]
MIELTQRQKQILNDLLYLNTPITAKDISLKFGVSVRTIRYDMDHIESWVEEKGHKLLKSKGKGVWIEKKSRKMVCLSSQIKSNEDWDDFVLNKEERIDLIQLFLLRSSGYITAQTLADHLRISRTTIMKDLKVVKEEIDKYGISLASKQKNGYVIEGNESDIREYLVNMLLKYMNRKSLFQNLTHNQRKSEKEENIFDFLNEEVSTLINVDDIKKAIKSGKYVYDFWIPDASYESLIVHIAVNINRLIKGQNISLAKDKVEAVRTYEEYSIAEKISETLESLYSVTLPEEEIANITIHLLSADLKLRELAEDDFDHKLYTMWEIVNQMVGAIEDSLNINSLKIQKLKEDIYKHLKLNYKKYNLGINNENPLLEQIKTKFVDSFLLANRMAEVYKKATGVNMSESEIGYIALHVEAQKDIYMKNRRRRALIVCTTGAGSAKILANRLRNSFPELDIVDITSVFELEDRVDGLKDIDLVISTVNLSLKDTPVIKISPLADKEDFGLLKEFLIESKSLKSLEQMETGQYILNSLMGILGKFVSVMDLATIRTELGFAIDFFHTSARVSEQNRMANQVFSQKLSYVFIHIHEMLKEIENTLDVRLSEEDRWGLLIHITMALPRWESREYNVESEIHTYEINYRELYGIVKKHMNIIKEKYGLDVPKEEIVYIIRYLI